MILAAAMSPESSATPDPRAAWTRLLATDLWVRWSVAAFAALTVFQLAGQSAAGWAVGLATLVFRGLVAATLWRDRDQIQVEERRCWRDVAAAFSLWLAADLLAFLSPMLPSSPIVAAVIEALRAASYVALILAAERSPDRSQRWRPTRLEQALAWPTAVLFILGLGAYFLLVPPQASPSRPIELPLGPLFHLVAVVYLGARFLYLARDTASPRWRLLYGALASSLGAAALQCLVIWRLPTLEGPAAGGLLAAVLGNVVFLLALATRARQLALPDSSAGSRFEQRSDFHFSRLSQQSLLHAAAFPVLHFAAAGLGLIDLAQRSRHEAVAVGVLVVLAAIALLQHRLLESKARELWFDREKVEGSLRSSETDLRLMVERYHANQRVRLSEEKFAKAFHVSPDAMAISTLADGLIVDVNESFVGLTGYPRDDILGKTSRELNLWTMPEERERMAELLKRDGRIREMEGRFRMKDGEIIIALVSAEQLIIDGEPYLVSVTHDITEFKRIESELAEKVELLEKAAENRQTRSS